MIKKAVLVCTLIFALIILFSGMFIVTEGEYVCIRRFGKIIDTKTLPVILQDAVY